ncbi:MAG: hypothetical protein ABEJ91_02480 [Candidatus Nanohaloarchaea archaeon]
MGDELRGKIVSICRDTAKSLDMARTGSRWHCEVTEVSINCNGVKKYEFYVHDKNSGREYRAEARVENEQNAEWQVGEV